MSTFSTLLPPFEVTVASKIGRAQAAIHELGGSEVAQLVHHGVDGGRVHLRGPGHPLVRQLLVSRLPGAVPDLNFGRVAEAEVEQLLVAEIVEALVEAHADVAGNPVNPSTALLRA